MCNYSGRYNPTPLLHTENGDSVYMFNLNEGMDHFIVKRFIVTGGAI